MGPASPEGRATGKSGIPPERGGCSEPTRSLSAGLCCPPACNPGPFIGASCHGWQPCESTLGSHVAGRLHAMGHVCCRLSCRGKLLQRVGHFCYPQIRGWGRGGERVAAAVSRTAPPPPGRTAQLCLCLLLAISWLPHLWQSAGFWRRALEFGARRLKRPLLLSSISHFGGEEALQRLSDTWGLLWIKSMGLVSRTRSSPEQAQSCTCERCVPGRLFLGGLLESVVHFGF